MIYLSICIPTYNRSKYLSDTIDSIICQPEFIETEEVEIVICDNCSTDNTEIIIQGFVDRFPSKIKYYKNERNIFDRNFEKVLSLGSGVMLKLNNDTLVLKPGALAHLLETVKYCIGKNYVPFLLEGKTDFTQAVVCENAADFISTTSYFCTWIGGFFIFNQSFSKMNSFSKESASQLTQVDVLMRLLKSGSKFLVIPNTFSTSVYPKNKGGYNLLNIFITNYFKILNNYLTNEDEIKVLKKEKEDTLFKFILPWIVNVRIDAIKKIFNYTFDISNYRKIIKEEFSFFIYLCFETRLFFYLVAKIIIPKTLIVKIKMFLNKEKHLG